MNINIIEKIESTVKPILDSLGIELVDIEYNQYKDKGQIRIFIDKEGGVTLEDCEKSSRYIAHSLDVNDFMPVSYNLEVSSPGLDRSLKNIKEYHKYKGRTVNIRTKVPIEGKNLFKGIIKDVKDDSIVEVITEKEEIINISFDIILKAKLEYKI